ncbi:hypothetical protein CPB84DRAFT_412719 [Gymnopilus junonius]|uniref:Integrase core domain-containing protein n=1 Tax=Gymnopilus junonius TaxID=109634 RepID=A0A9P5NB76_GYMJU|nr:hypothetical protein CPB84DRAFT_412719 [Gymnopilus junonius]
MPNESARDTKFMARNPTGKNQHKPAPPEAIIQPWVELYHSIGTPDVEIVELLKEHYDTQRYYMGTQYTSGKTLQRRRKEWGLKSTRQQKHTAESIAPVVAEIRQRFPNKGAEGIRKTLMLEYKMHVSRKIIEAYLLATEPNEVKKRKGRRFKRKRYYAAGVNDVWAQDQHDKWGHKYGLWFHSSLDTYSSWINWLKVWWTNSNPRLILNYYLTACREMSGCPLTTQSDPGSENNGVANVHTMIRHTLDPSLQDTRQHRIMRKHNNVKSESLWSIFRRDFTPGFENAFDYGVNHGLYDIEDPLERLVFRWLAIPWIQAEVDNWVFQRNFTAPRHDKNKILPQGVPAIIRAHPHRYGGQDYKIGIPDALFDKMEAEYASHDHPVFQLTPPEFDTRANKYYNEMGRPLVTSNSFWSVYQGLLSAFKNSDSDDATEELANVLSGLDEATRHISEKDKDEVKLIPGLKPLRLGATVVGDGNGDRNSDGGEHGPDSDGSFEAEMTDSEEEQEEGEREVDHAPPSLVASMTPSLRTDTS